MAKLMALEAYADEMRTWPHSRSYQSVGSSVGVEAAEAFMLGRQIWL